MKKFALPLLTLLSAIAAILALDGGLGLPAALGFVFKPLTTLLIVFYAARREGQAKRWVIGGLLCSLIGDVALMLPGGFVPGLLAFLAAHLAYLRAFTRVRRFGAWWPGFAAYALAMSGILYALWPNIGAALHLPVAAYVLCLGAMAAQTAAVGWRSRGTPDAARGAVLALGGLIFVVSDGSLAINKFAGPVATLSLLVLPTYWLAQWCIASWLQPRNGMKSAPN